MLGYPKTNRGLHELIDDELGENPLPHQVARKAQTRGAVSRDALSLTGTIMGTISRRNHPQGLSVDYTTSPQPFPDGTGRMNRYADLTGISEAMLLANIASGGGPGTVLTVSGGGEPVSVGLEIIGSAPDIVVGTWHPVTATGATLLEWSIKGTSAGNVILGLCQFIVR